MNDERGIRRQPFREADVMRAVKGAMKAGMVVGSVELHPEGRIVICAATTSAQDSAEDAFEAWVREDAARRKREEKQKETGLRSRSPK